MSSFCDSCEIEYPEADPALRCPRCGQPTQTAPLATASTADLERGVRILKIDPVVDELVQSELGKYELSELLGRGAMGRVYLARHSTLHRQCALKVLDSQRDDEDGRYVERFLREARATAAVVHPNIVTVHDIDEFGPLHVIEMEFVNGPSLEDHVRVEGPPSPQVAASWLCQVTSGLAAAHDAGLVHRDVKPSNVLLTGAVAKLADFGLVRPLGVQGGRLAGTPQFMAPELFEGRQATEASDIYAAGITFFFALTGRLPFVASSLAELARLHREAELPDLSQWMPRVPSGVVRVLQRCVAKEPERRYASAHRLENAFKALYGHLRPLEDLVEEALGPESTEEPSAETPYRWQGGSAGVAVTVQLARGRSQRVLVEEVHSSLDGEDLLRISSPCAPVRERYTRRALELNGEVNHGALSIQDWNGKPFFVMRNNYPRDTCDPEELRSSVMAVAETADEVERVLTGEDRH